jgi:hypothetical protein
MADDYAYADDGGENDGNALGSFFYPFALVAISVTSFWVQSVVTEER